MASEIRRLTDKTIADAQVLLFRTKTPVASNKGISISFNFYSYGGVGDKTGGDGICLAFIDGAQSSRNPGAFGSSLGYAADSKKPGIKGGYLGVGLDEFGNYSSVFPGRVGGETRRPNSIAVRGSEATRYKFLGGTDSLTNKLPLSNIARGANPANSRRLVRIDLTATGVLSVFYDLNRNGRVTDPGERVLFLNTRAPGAKQNTPLPKTFKFALSASTGAATNIHEFSDFKISTLNGIPITGSFEKSIRRGGDTRADKADVIVGSSSDETIIGNLGGDTVTGGGGADFFAFDGFSKGQALRDSVLKTPDVIKDFNQKQGDRFLLDFDNNLDTLERPRSLFYAGAVKGSNLKQALDTVYADKDSGKKGKQALKANDAVIFKFGSRTYLSVNDNQAPFSSRNDLVADVTGIQFKAGDARRIGSLKIGDYFAV